MTRQRARTCPSWCVADHPREDEPAAPRHRGETLVVPGIAVRPKASRVEGIELLVELHAEDGDPVVAVYIGDGTETGLDITTETAARLMRRVSEVLRAAGFRSA